MTMCPFCGGNKTTADHDSMCGLRRIIPSDAQLIEQIERVLKTFPGNYGYSTLRLALDRIANPPKDDELSQAYQQGYQDGRRGLEANDRRYRWLRDHKCNHLYLTHDADHAVNYVTAKEWIDEYCRDEFDDTPESEIQAMKDTNTIWSLQVYPITPIGFNIWHAATLDTVIDAAMAAQP